MLFDKSILAIVREVEEPIEVEDDEEDGDDTIGDKYLEKLTTTQLRNTLETLLDLSLFMESDKVQRCTMEISKLIEKELSQSLKQACIKDYFA